MTSTFTLEDDEGNTLKVPTTTVDNALKLVERLTKENSTLTIFKDDSESHLCISHGDIGYVVYHTPDNLKFFSLISEEESNNVDKVMIYLGGQNSDQEIRKLNTLNNAICAARHFLETDQRDRSLIWEAD